MPTYQYACTACDHSFEQFQSFTEDSLTDCPQCQGRLRKVFNAVGVVFKGSGFYRTDSRTDSSSSSGATTTTTTTDSTTSSPTTPASGGDKGSAATTTASKSESPAA